MIQSDKIALLLDILLEMEMGAEEKQDEREEKMLKLEQEMEEKRRERELHHATKMQAMLGNFLQQFTSCVDLYYNQFNPPHILHTILILHDPQYQDLFMSSKLHLLLTFPHPRHPIRGREIYDYISYLI